VVLRFRLHLESLGLAAGTINQRLAAVRRLGFEAADSGLLSPELAAGIRRVKGVKQLGSRSGNWLNHEQAKLLLEKADGEGLRNIRDVAMIAILLSRCTKFPEYDVRGCFPALKFRNPPSCLHSNPGMKTMHIKDITASLYLYLGRTSASTSSGIYLQ
jgi:hypothetical protein